MRRRPAESAGTLSGNVQDVWHLVALTEIGNYQFTSTRGLIGRIIGAVLADDGTFLAAARQGQGPAPTLGIQGFARVVITDIDDLGHCQFPANC